MHHLLNAIDEVSSRRHDFSVSSPSDPIAPELLSKINERRVLEFVQATVPASRASIARACGMTPPTVSKAVASLIRQEFLEESGVSEGFGRPGKLLRLAAKTANVLGLVVDADMCWIGSARLDGQISKDVSRWFKTPETYPGLLAAIEQNLAAIFGDQTCLPGARFRGLGVSVPGLLNSRSSQTVMSPNLHMLDGMRLAEDLALRTKMRCVVLQECVKLEPWLQSRSRPVG
jgi:N-acetylglucosamine repressor